MKDFNVAIVGCGKWGINHVRTAYKLFGNKLKYCCDEDPKNEGNVKKISQDIQFTTDIDPILKYESINAVIVATPAETHFDITRDLMNAGKNVLVEKPITLNSGEAK